MKKRTQADYIRTALRVPPDLHARLHDVAKEAGRTFNAEILNRLERTFSEDDERARDEAYFQNAAIEALEKVAKDGSAPATHGLYLPTYPRPDDVPDIVRETIEQTLESIDFDRILREGFERAQQAYLAERGQPENRGKKTPRQAGR